MAKKCGKPLVIFFDEADCLCYDPLIAFLRQVRNGYINREETPFPASIALVGLRNIKDYRMRVRPDGASVGQASPFNIITKVMSMRIFSEDEMRALYAQHTAETGQNFEEETLSPRVTEDDIGYCLDLGLLKKVAGVLSPANPIYSETIGRYMTRRTQDEIQMKHPENPWGREDGSTSASTSAGPCTRSR